jgi:RimJ/RimL family protein N-acetyltransferase
MFMITLRKAIESDKPRIAEISSQIWEGEDYVPEVLDTWLADKNGEVIVAIDDGILISFARRSYLLSGYAWFQGARTDPLYRNRGASQEISRYFLEAVRREGADLVGLSTYIENHSSIHIIEKNGFRKVASFVHLEAGHDAPVRKEGRSCHKVVEVSAKEAIDFIQTSQALRVAQGRFCHGWESYPFERDPGKVISNMEHLLGIKKSGQLIGLLCIGNSEQEYGFLIDFADGRADAFEDLLRHSLYLAQKHRSMELMVPKDGAEESPALEILRKLGFQADHGFDPDVFVYERKP